MIFLPLATLSPLYPPPQSLREEGALFFCQHYVVGEGRMTKGRKILVEVQDVELSLILISRPKKENQRNKKFFLVVVSYDIKGTPTKRPVTKRPVTKRPFTKRPVTECPGYKSPGYQTSILQNVQITKRPGHTLCNRTFCGCTMSKGSNCDWHFFSVFTYKFQISWKKNCQSKNFLSPFWTGALEVTFSCEIMTTSAMFSSSIIYVLDVQNP